MNWGQLHGVAVEDGYEEKIRENITYSRRKTYRNT